MRTKFGSFGVPCVAYNPKTGHAKIPEIEYKKSNDIVNAFTVDDDEYILIMYKSYEELNAKLTIAKALAENGNSMSTIDKMLSYELPMNI